MADATIGALRVVLGIDTAQFENGLSAAQKHLRGVGRQFESVGSQITAIGAGMTVAITAPLIAAGFAASRAATEAADAMGQVEAALTSMGDASGRTKDQLAGMASGIMRASLYDDDDILRKVTANLLTFGNVAGQVFDRAQVVATDLATRMQMDLQPATLLVGKALNDPLKGMTALGRAGIQFTAAQKEAIKAMVATGNVAGAQGMILTELERQFGGAAAAAQKTEPYDRLRDVLNDLSETAGGIINTHLAPLLETVAALGDRFNGLSPQMQTFAVAGLAVAAALGPALVVVGSIVGALGTLTTALATGGVLAGLAGFAAAAVPFVAAGAAIAAAVYLFRDDLMPVFKEFSDAAKAALGPALQQIMAAAKEAFAALGPAVKAIVDVVGPILAGLSRLFLVAFGPIVIRLVEVLAAGIGNAFSVIAAALRVLTALFQGDWSQAWNAAGSLVMTIVRGIGNIVEAVFPGIGRIVGNMVEEVKGWLGRKLGDVFDGVIRRVRQVSDAFFNMYDAVVGHSYVPDMVVEVGQWMDKLDQVMVRPAERATQTAAEAFEGFRDRTRAALEGILTDRERIALDFRRQKAELDALLAIGGARGGLSQEQYDLALSRRTADRDSANAGLDAEGLTNGAREMPTFDFLEPFNRSMVAMNRSIEQARDRFADAFSQGLESAVRGDWIGVLQSVLGDVLSNTMRSAGRALFDAGSGGKGGGFDLGSLVGGLFGGGKSPSKIKLPKFANEGTIKAGGSGGLDTQLVAFWKNPSEQVDVYEPGNDTGPGGGDTYVFDMTGAVVTEQLMRDVNARVAAGEARVRSAVPGLAVKAVDDTRTRRHG